MNFWKMFGASALAYFVVGVVLTILSFAVIAGIISSAASFTTTKPDVDIKKNSILKISLNDGISDNGFSEFKFSSSFISQYMGLNDIISSIKKAKTEKNIEGILLNVDNLSTGIATAQEIREALEDFKSSGKFIYAYSEVYTQGAYYLASVADSVFVYPEGIIEMKGLLTEVAFLKDMLDKIGVEMQVIRGSNNQFKSAVEPYMYNEMSDANKEQVSKFLGSLWSNIKGSIAESRSISTEQLQNIADNLLVQSGKDAVTYKLADKTLYQDELTTLLKEKLDIDEEDDINFISLKKYNKKNARGRKKVEKKGNVAVVYASGEIVSGKGSNNIIGSDRIARAIRKARENDSVKAIVLRVNSPGGSALASDVIWREVTLTNGIKPIVVSMGDVAASGGYYISCAADKIYANENTITGSIGVFGVLPNAQELFEEKFGIHFDGVTTAKNADLGMFTKPLTKEQYDIIQAGVDSIYSDFLQKVSNGRNTLASKSDVDKIGQGRVWAGNDALENGLIDEFGGLYDAINGAATLANIAEEDIQTITYPRPKQNKFSDIIEIIETIDEEDNDDSRSVKIKSRFINHLEQFETIISNDKIQARLPFVIVNQ